MRNQGNQKPGNWLSKAIYSITRKRFGRVLAPVRIHGHSPSALLGFALMLSLQKRYKHIDPQLVLLAQVRVGGLVGCGF